MSDTPEFHDEGTPIHLVGNFAVIRRLFLNLDGKSILISFAIIALNEALGNLAGKSLQLVGLEVFGRPILFLLQNEVIYRISFPNEESKNRWIRANP